MTQLLLPLISLLSLLFGGDEAEIVFAGDAMMHQAQLDAARRTDGSYDFNGCFDAVAPWFQSADYAVVNLETPVGTPPYSGYPCFNAPPNYLDALHNAGFDLFLTANNHTLDRRDRGLRATIEALDARSLAHIGTWRDSATRDAGLPFVRDIGGIMLGFLNYTYGTNGIVVRGDAVVDYIDRSRISDDISRARAAGAELLCVCVHWGDEYHMLPNAAQRSLADFLLAEGVEIIIGGHPHVVQPMEMRRTAAGDNAVVVYSLGNFISNMKTRDTRGGAVVSVRIGRDANGRAHVAHAGWRLHFTVPPTGHGGNFRVVPADSCDTPMWLPQCDAFRRSAEAIFSRHNRGVLRLP